MKIKSWIICCLILILLSIIGFMTILIYNRVHMRRSNETDAGSEDMNDDNVLHKFQRSAAFVNKIRNMKKMIRIINERQHIFNSKNNSGLEFNTTVLVIHVHDNKTYLSIFLDSIHRVLGVSGSLLIFAHDYYDDEINSLIRSMPCPRVMQIFYPYSTQLHPNVYPGEDSRFYQELNQFIDSKKRDPVLAQTKLFWWWTANQVFDFVRVLKKYNGYIYFLETELYLANDFMHIIRMLEQLQATFCPDCQILSLGSRAPEPEMYYPENSYLIVSVWGWSNYSNSGIGFNRTTWNEIKRLDRQFCYFKDSSWEYSLKHLATKTHQGQFFMLSTEGPRFFPTTGCGAFRNGTNCDLTSNHHDILKFIPKIMHGRFARNFKLKFDGSATTSMEEARGQWGDARDIHLCMYFSGKDRREQY